MSLTSEDRIPIGTKVRIHVPQTDKIPGGWASIKSMKDIGILQEYFPRIGRPTGVRIHFPMMKNFFTEAWCIEEISDDNQTYLRRLRELPPELIDLEHMFSL